MPYEPYTQTAPLYDRTRTAVGIEIILGCLATTGDLRKQCVIDAGCGTGNYAGALGEHVGAVHAVDRSESMLAQARAKVVGGDVVFHRAAVDALSVDDGVADGVVVNQVLHHLDGDDAVAAALAEFYRVLKPGGALVVNTCSHRQLRCGFWPYALLPAAVLEAMVARHADVPRLQALLAAAGFAHRSVVVPVDAVLQGAAYFDARGPADAAWRGGDSIWSLLTAEEVAAVERRIATLARDDALDDFVRAADAERKNCGQMSFVFSTRA